MTERYMLDTNMVSHFIKGHARVDAQVMAMPMGALCISSITEGELLFGLAKRPQAHRLKTLVTEFLARIDSLPWSSETAAHYGPLRARLAASGKSPGALDVLIAAHALEMGAILVTNDAALLMVEELRALDWTR